MPTASVRETILVALDELLRAMTPANGYRYEWNVYREITNLEDEAAAVSGKASCFVYATGAGWTALESEFVRESLSVTLECRILHPGTGSLSAATVRDRMIEDVVRALGTKWIDGATWGGLEAEVAPLNWSSEDGRSDEEVAGSIDVVILFDAAATNPTSQEHVA